MPFINKTTLVHILRESRYNDFKDMTYFRGLPVHQTLATTRRAWKATVVARNAGELTTEFERIWHDLPRYVIGDLSDTIRRRVSACISARGGFTTY